MGNIFMPVITRVTNSPTRRRRVVSDRHSQPVKSSEYTLNQRLSGVAAILRAEIS